MGKSNELSRPALFSVIAIQCVFWFNFVRFYDSTQDEMFCSLLIILAEMLHFQSGAK